MQVAPVAHNELSMSMKMGFRLVQHLAQLLIIALRMGIAGATH